MQILELENHNIIGCCNIIKFHLVATEILQLYFGIRVFDKIFGLDQIGSSQAMSEPLYF